MELMDASGAPQFVPVELTSPLVSLKGFHIILWTGFAVCTMTCVGRVYIRYMCFRRLLVDDWVMIFALSMLLAIAALGQVYLKDVYMLMAVSNGQVMLDADFPAEAQRGLRAFGTTMLLSYLGIWAIKLNFLLFFRRLGRQIVSYTILWWAVLIITLACGGVNLGIMQFKCMFGPIEHIMTVCPQYPTLKQTYTLFKLSCILDVVTDVLIICFPIIILWRVRIDPRKKIILSSIFLLVTFTIAVTIVRGSIFGGVYKTLEEAQRRNLNVSWIWFWFYIEFTVAFVIASLVSFRALFAQREQRRVQAYQDKRTPTTPEKNAGFRRRAQHLHDTLLSSFKTSETVSDMGLPMPVSGRLSTSFIMDIEGEYASRTELTPPVKPKDSHSSER